MNPANHHPLAYALSTAELMGAGAVRSLDLLRVIDGTLDSLLHHTQLFETAEQAFTNITHAIQSGSSENVIPEAELIPVLEKLQNSLVASHADCTRKMKAAISDPRLCDEDGVADAYAALLQALDALNSATETLRWSVLESNAEAEKGHTPKVLSKPEEIDSFLDSL